AWVSESMMSTVTAPAMPTNSPPPPATARLKPQVNAVTGDIIGLEALTRWSGFEGEIIGPDVFMKVIENSGLISDFSAWLFDSVFKQMKLWHDILKPAGQLSISINLSAKQLKNKELTSIIKDKCQEYGVSPACIILEITETAIIEDPKQATTTLQALNEAGFELSLDDFGTGYSSLAYLRSMPFQSVKIDKSFIQDVLDDNDDAEIVSTIISLAKRLRLKVIAEGVSSQAIKAWLIDNSCNLHQGFYFYKPLPPHEVYPLLLSNRKDKDLYAPSKKTEPLS
ncbi:MAG: EAL domain-containing protein, partial [Pseudomonadota bacterium]